MSGRVASNCVHTWKSPASRLPRPCTPGRADCRRQRRSPQRWRPTCKDTWYNYYYQILSEVSGQSDHLACSWRYRLPTFESSPPTPAWPGGACRRRGAPCPGRRGTGTHDLWNVTHHLNVFFPLIFNVFISPQLTLWRGSVSASPRSRTSPPGPSPWWRPPWPWGSPTRPSDRGRRSRTLQLFSF